jgi:hypothetical protein
MLANGMRISRGRLGAPLAILFVLFISFACYASGVTSRTVG